MASLRRGGVTVPAGQAPRIRSRRPGRTGERLGVDPRRSGPLPAPSAGRRAGIWEPGAWALLGGGREPEDISLEATVRRELREEAGLELPVLEPFAVELVTGTDGTAVPVQIFAGRWNGDPADLHLTEGVMLAWFPRRRCPACG
ncbi:NUDIX domain-containing protein [Streptomyces sp. MS1.HAVA.3]|uniref:NUDIX domain-containing protein n=1 Tax=Streptomyces caledonius TaxID=3134107 RepID=A0ABU8UFC3_9ACTN